jgi:deazaflavin-dependent oxidoreductase (nitroreductase family)
MPSLVHTVLVIQEKLYVASDGWVGHRLLGVPSLLLRTTGKRTGETRTNALTYAPEGDRYLVVASNGGSPKAPSWLHNLRAQPEVEIQVGRTRHPATARELGKDDPEYERLFAFCDERNRGRFAAYQSKTTRTIPIVELVPHD